MNNMTKPRRKSCRTGYNEPMDFQLWVLIPIVAILAGVLKEWVKVRTQQKVLGSSNNELERTATALQARQRELLDRIQNLETIVVSQTWDALHDKGLSPAERELKVASTIRRELKPSEEDANRQRAEQLAQRLQA